MNISNYKTKLNKITTFIFDVDGVLTNGKILITSDGQMYRSMNTKDGFAIKLAISKGYRIAIISGGNNKGIIKRLSELNISEIYLGVTDKLNTYKNLIRKNNITGKEILYMGDDIPDIPVMKNVILSACPKDAVSDVKNLVDYVSDKYGGEGCVREIIEQVLKVQNNW